MAFKFSADGQNGNSEMTESAVNNSVTGKDFVVTSASEDISGSTEWRIKESSVSLIVHTAGKIASIESEFDGKALRLDPPNIGEIWLVPSGTEYASQVKGDTVNYLEIVMDQSLLAETVDEESDIIELKPIAGGFDAVLLEYFKGLMSLKDKHDDVSKIERDQMIRQIAGRIVTEFSVNNKNSSRREISFQQTDALQIQEFIFEHISEQITLERLCELTGETPHRFLWAFNNTFHTSPAQFIIGTRLRRARKLLAETGKDITTIAMETGFSDHSHLSTMFKKHTGMTPSEFRMQQNGKAG